MSEQAEHVPAGADVQRERILRAAARALAEFGFDRARLRDVSKAAGVSIGLIQHYFETRDGLFRDAFAWSVDELIGRWECVAVGEPEPWRRIELLVQELTTDPDLTRRCGTWLEFCASASRHLELRGGVQRVYDVWRRLMAGIISAGVEQGVFAPRLPASTVVDLISTLVDGCDMAIAAGIGEMTPDRYRGLLLDTASMALGVVRTPGEPARPTTGEHTAGTGG
jgi:AcrR family transcriptional regulator